MRKVRKYLIWAAFLRLWAGTVPVLKKQKPLCKIFLASIYLPLIRPKKLYYSPILFSHRFQRKIPVTCKIDTAPRDKQLATRKAKIKGVNLLSSHRHVISFGCMN